MLHVIESVSIRLPDIHCGSNYRRTIGSLDQRRDKTWLALHSCSNVRPGWQVRCPIEMKWAKHRLLRDALGSFVILCYHELGQAERIRQQDKFLTLVVALLTHARDKLDTLEPFVLSELHLTRKRVHMLDQARHNFLQTRVRRACKPSYDLVRNVMLIQILHIAPPFRSGCTTCARGSLAQFLLPIEILCPHVLPTSSYVQISL